MGEIARSSLSALGKEWEEQVCFQVFSGDILTLPREAKIQTVMYVPTKPNYKGVDALFFKLVGKKGKCGKFNATVVPTQITIAESNSGTEAAFSPAWPGYEVELRTSNWQTGFGGCGDASRRGVYSVRCWFCACAVLVGVGIDRLAKRNERKGVG